jgi:cysteine desulfurase
MRPIYIDHFATTPLDPRVFAAQVPFFQEDFGNPANTSNWYGQRASDAVDSARLRIATALGIQKTGRIVFTSGSTESNNLLFRGIAERSLRGRRHVVATGIEHKSVLEPLRWLSLNGYSVTLVPPNSGGVVEPRRVISAITTDTVLVSAMAVNNEVGTIQPLEEIGSAAEARGVLFHTDASQAIGKIPIDMNRLNVDFLSLSAHKLYGPKGVGALCCRGAGATDLLAPQLLGGGQEGKLRSGTLNVPGIVGLATALDIMCEVGQAEQSMIRQRRDRLLSGLVQAIDGVEVNGDLEYAISGALNVSFKGVRSSALLSRVRNIGVSGAAACGGQSAVSHVLESMGYGRERIQSALRFCVGRFNSDADIDAVVEQIADAIQWIRSRRQFGSEVA